MPRMTQREKEQRRRGRVSPVVPYTGRSTVNTRQFTQPQRSSGIPMGGSRTTTGPAQQHAGQSGGMSGGIEGLLGMKEGYDQVNNAYKGGANAKDWYNNPGKIGLSPQERLEDTGNMIRDMYTGEDTYSNAEQFYSTVDNAYEGMPKQFEGFPTKANSTAATPATPPQDMGVWNQTQPMPQTTAPTNVGPGSAAQASYNHPGVAGVSGNASQSAMSGLSGPTSQSLGLTPAGSTAPNFGQGAFNSGLENTSLLSDTSLAMPTDAASTLSQGGVGGEAAIEGSSAAAEGGSNVAGKVGAGLGVAFNAYDMVENGVNAGNAMGLVGSGILLSVGAANAWNPVGWALLAGSAAYSLFG